MAFSPDGKLLAGAVGGPPSSKSPAVVVLWDLATRHTVWTLSGHTARISALAFSLDGKTLASGGEDKTVRFWEVATGRETGRIENNPGWVRSVVFTSDGKSLVIGSGLTLKVWDVAGNRLRAVLEPDDYWVRSIVRAPNGRMLASAGGTRTRGPGLARPRCGCTTSPRILPSAARR